MLTDFQSPWWISRKSRNRSMHALNGNPAKTGKGTKVKAFAISAFQVRNKIVFSSALSKLCGQEIKWISERHGDRFNGVDTGMERFIAFWWRAKGRASFSGKGAGAAKKWVLQELGISQKPIDVKQLRGKKRVALWNLRLVKKEFLGEKAVVNMV